MRRLLDGQNSIIVHMYEDSASCATCEVVCLEYIHSEHKLRFRIAVSSESFPNLDAFNLPNDLAKLNHTMSRLGVCSFYCSSDACGAAMQRAAQGLLEEVGLGPRLAPAI